MALILEALETARRNASGRQYLEARAGADHQETGAVAQSPGFDGRPLEGDLLVSEKAADTGEPVFVGALDLKNAGTAEPGEARIYARDASGAVVCEIWARADGSIRIYPGPGVKCEVGTGARLPVARDGDPVPIGILPIPPTALDFWAWVAAVNSVLVPLSGGSLPPVPPTGISGAAVQASAVTLEAE